MRARCEVTGCRGVAWAGRLCNYHALLKVRGGSEGAERGIAKVATLRRQVQQQAAALGLKLTREEPMLAHVKGRDRKVRSPVG